MYKVNIGNNQSAMSDSAQLHLPVQILSYIDLAERLYVEGNTSVAASIHLLVKAEFMLLYAMNEEEDTLFRNIIMDRLESPMIHVIRRKGRSFVQPLRFMEILPQWRVIKRIGSSTRVLFDAGSNYYGMIGTLNSPLIYVIGALQEVEFYPNWLKNCVQSQQILKPDCTSSVVRLILNMLIVRRELFCEHTFHVLNDGDVLFQSNSNDNKVGLHRLVGLQKYHRANSYVAMILAERDGPPDYGAEENKEESAPDFILGYPIKSNKVTMLLFHCLNQHMSSRFKIIDFITDSRCKSNISHRSKY